MKVIKRDIEAVEMAVDIYETNYGAGDENPDNHQVLSDLKKLLAKMKKDKPST